jgi:hypothetical protein
VRKTVYVHIGAPGAGATSFRRHLKANRAALRGASIDLLDTSPDARDGAPGSPRGNAVPLDEIWNRVAATTLVSECQTLVISDERLVVAPGDQAEQGLTSLADHDVHVIYAMPDFGAALFAEWQRHVIETWRAVPLADWINELVAGRHSTFWRAYDLDDVFVRWTVPSDNVHVVITPQSDADSDGLWKRFASIIGAPADLIDHLPASNDLLGVDELALLQQVRERWKARPTDGPRPSLQDQDLYLRTLLARCSDPRLVHLPADHRSWIEKQATAQSEFLAASGFAIVGSLDDLELDGARFEERVADPHQSRMLVSGIDVAAQLVDQLTATRARREAVERSGPSVDAPARGSIRRLVGRSHRVLKNPSAARYAVRRRVRVAFGYRGRPTYYLHIGAPKSGSSYLQSLLWQNRHALLRDGVCLPGGSQTDHFFAGWDFRGRPYVTQAPQERWRGAWDRMIEDAERSGCRKVVISSEFLADSPPENIITRLERLGDAEVHVIYAVRDFAGLLASEWQQAVKVAPLPPWPEWLEETARRGVADGFWLRHNVGAVCERWSARSRDQLHILVLPGPGAAPDELWRRFQSIVGWTVSTRVDGPRANEALGYSQAELLRRLQHRLGDAGPQHQRVRVTKDVLADQVLGAMERIDSPLIPGHLRAWVEAESEKRRQQILGSAGHVVGAPDDELGIADSRFSATPTPPSVPVMVDAAASAIARLARGLGRGVAEPARP